MESQKRDMDEINDMQFIVDPAIFERFPGLSLPVVIANEVDNGESNERVQEQWRAGWAEASEVGAAYGNAQSHPSVRPWRERFKGMGVSGKEFPSSIEAMLRRALKGGEPFQINPLVDFYNTISLRYTVPAGAFDLDEMHGPLELRLTRSGDMFTALDEDMPQAVPTGEVAYCDGQTVLTRHFVWRQARTALITTATRSLFMVSEVMGELGHDVAKEVLSALEIGLQRYFGAQTRAFLVDVEHPTIAW